MYMLFKNSIIIGSLHITLDKRNCFSICFQLQRHREHNMCHIQTVVKCFHSNNRSSWAVCVPHLQKQHDFWTYNPWHKTSHIVQVNCESSLLRPIMPFLVGWRPLVAIVIIMAVKEAIQWSSIKRETDGTGRRSGMHGRINKHRLCDRSLCPDGGNRGNFCITRTVILQ